MSATRSAPTQLGLGAYTVADVARLVHTPPETVRRWVSRREGLVPRQSDDAQLLTFLELMEVYFISLFRTEGVSLQVIRKVSERAAQRLGSPYPFAVKRFDTDGRTVFATLLAESDDGVLVEDLRRGQYVFDSIVRPFFHKLDYLDSDERVIRFWPQTKKGRVVLDPQRKFGAPIDAATGMPTRTIYDALQAGGGQSPAEVAEWLNIPLAAVNAAADFERSIAA